MYEARLFPELEYAFKHALTHEVAYGSVLQERRQVLHARIVEAIERLYADRIAEQVELLAHHALRGRAMSKAVKYLRQAGTKAAARSANREAIGFFEQALALLDESPQTPESLSEALDIRIALGPALVAVKGAPSREVEASYLSALGLVDELKDESRRFPVLWGLWYGKFTRGEYAEAVQAGERLLEFQNRDPDGGQVLEAHHSLWATLMAMGRLSDAMSHLHRGLTLYDREKHGSQAFVYGGHDAGTCCRYHLALNQWLLGFPDQAVRTLGDALGLAQQLNHPLTSAIALYFAALIHLERGDRDAVSTIAEQLRSLTSEYGFQAWADSANVLPYAIGEAKLDRQALAELAHKSRSAVWRRVVNLCLVAQLCAKTGDPDTGRRLLTSISASDRSGLYASEIVRIEGELALTSDRSATAEAERCFRSALEIAQSRSEKSFELRAAMSLARLWQSQRRREEAHRLLGDAYGWFTEGFDTADLRAAQALLKELA
jgi:tetratricopeptide (TPR) repeat protein